MSRLVNALTDGVTRDSLAQRMRSAPEVLPQREVHLVERETAAQAQWQMVVEKFMELGQWQQRLEQREAALSLNERQLESAKVELAQREARVTPQFVALHQVQAQLAKQGEALQHRQAQVELQEAALQQQRLELEARLDDYAQQVAEYTEQLRALQRTVRREFAVLSLSALPTSSRLALEPALDEALERADAGLGIQKICEQSLTSTEKQLLYMRFGVFGYSVHTYRELGDQFGVTDVRARQYVEKALRKLRHPVRSRQLRKLWPGSPGE